MNIVIRADSGDRIGSGHIMRCLALCTYLKRKVGSISFVCAEHPGNIISTIPYKTYSIPVTKEITDDTNTWLGNRWEDDMAVTKNIVKNIDDTIIIVDHYVIDERWEAEISQDVRKIVVIDDLHNRKHNCDLLIDQFRLSGNPYKKKGLLPMRCKSLIGYKYAILDQHFVKNIRQRMGCLRVHVFFGGSDHVNMTERFLEEIVKQKVWFFIFDIVIGPINHNYERIMKKFGCYRNILIHHDIKISQMANLLRKADISVGCSGMSSIERCASGLFSFVINIAKNQMGNAIALEKKGVVDYLGMFNDPCVYEKAVKELVKMITMTPSQQSRILRYCSSVVDGLGGQRVSNEIVNLVPWKLN